MHRDQGRHSSSAGSGRARKVGVSPAGSPRRRLPHITRAGASRRRWPTLAAIVSLLLAGTVVVAPTAMASTLQATVLPPLDGTVYSSPDESPPHHLAYTGDYSFDVGGNGSAYARFRNPNGNLSLSVAGIGRACASGNFADGGDRITLNVMLDGMKVGTVAYAHLTNFPITSGSVPVGARIGDLVTAAHGVRSSSCWTGPHVHVEPRNDKKYGCFFPGLLNRRVDGSIPLGLVGGEWATAVNQRCPAGVETPAPVNRPPFGSFDTTDSPIGGRVHVTGWAIDPDAPTTPVTVHVYVGGPAGTPDAQGIDVGPATASRPDVAAAYPGTGSNHGIDATFSTGKTGEQNVCLHAIDIGGTQNVLLGCRTVTIGSPTPAYSFSGIVTTSSAVAVGESVHLEYTVTNTGTARGRILPGVDRQPQSVTASTSCAGVEYTDPATFGVLLDPGQSFTCRYDTPRSTGEPAVFRAQVFEWGVDGFSFLRELADAPTLVSLPGTITPGTPTISGTVKVDRTLTAAAGTWSPIPVTTKYQWNANGQPVAGATGRTFVVPANLVGASMSVTVTGSRDGYADVSKVSAMVGPVKEGSFSSAPTPVITGATVVGGTLIADAGVWGPQPVSLSYEWRINSSTVTGATTSSFVVPPAAVGKKITVRVTGSKPGYQTVTRSSAASGVVGG